jgi:hypothetical protein
MSVKQTVGTLLVLIALTPIVGFVILSVRHMHTVGLTTDLRGAVVIALFAFGDLALLIGGIYLLSRLPLRAA